MIHFSGLPSSPSSAFTAALRAVRISASEPESHMRPKRPTDETCRILEGGDPLLKDNARVEQIEATLRKMPHEMVMEIWGAIADAVPGWGPQRPKSSSSPIPSDTGETA